MGVLGNNIRLGSSAAGDYEVSKSLRYNNGDSPHMQRTLTETSNVQTFTYSCWFKVTGNFGGHRGAFIDAGTTMDGNNVFKCNIASDDKLYVLSTIGGQYKEHFRSDAYFRDPSAWMHLVLRCDSTQSTAANRVRVYINGTEISGTKTNHPDHFLSLIHI